MTKQFRDKEQKLLLKLTKDKVIDIDNSSNDESSSADEEYSDLKIQSKKFMMKSIENYVKKNIQLPPKKSTITELS